MKKIFKVRGLFVNIENIATMTKPNINDEEKYKTCTVFINGQKYYCDNYIESYSIICNDKTEKEYQEFKKEVLELFDAFINQ